MNKSRINIPAQTLSREEAERLVGEITELKTKEQKLTAEMNRRITEARQDYEGTLGNIGKEIADKMARVRDWADANADAFGKVKSLEMTHAVIGWRIGQPMLKTVSGWTWDRVLEKLRALPHWARYVRTKSEVNKEQLLGDRDTIAADEFRSIGVRVVQDERFFVDPKIETPEARVKEAA